MLKISAQGKALIKHYEGLRLIAYLCPAGVWTIGYGHTETAYEGQRIDVAQASDLLSSDLIKYEQAVNRLVKVPLTQKQFDALVSFTFNLGAGSLQRSSLLYKLNQRDYRGAAKEFTRWVYARDGKTNKMRKLAGLVRRRKAEQKMFESDILYENKIAKSKDNIYAFQLDKKLNITGFKIEPIKPDPNNEPIPDNELPLPTIKQEGKQPQIKTDEAKVKKVAAVTAAGGITAGGAIEVANQVAPSFSILSYLDWRVGVVIVVVVAIGGGIWWIWGWRRK